MFSTIGLLTEPAEQVQLAVKRQLERVRAFSEMAVHYVYRGVPVRIEHAAVGSIEPASLSSATVHGLRSAVHPAGIFRRNRFYSLASEQCLVGQNLLDLIKGNLRKSVVVAFAFEAVLGLGSLLLYSAQVFHHDDRAVVTKNLVG